VWASSFFFIADEYRKAMADPYLAFFTLACLWSWVKAGDKGKTHSVLRLLVFYSSIGLGLLAKGPPLFLVVGIPLVAFHVCYRRRVPRNIAAHAIGLLIVAALVVPWVAYVLRHVPNVVEMWRYESVGELPGADNVEKARPFWFYLPNLFAIALPWTPAWLAGIALPFMRRRRPASFSGGPERQASARQRKSRWFPLIWYFAVVLCFSIITVKKNTYLLPAMPAQAMLAGQGLAAMLAICRRRYSKGALLAWVQAGIGLVGAIVTFVLVFRVRADRGVAMTLAALAIAASCGAVAELRARRASLWLWRQAIAYVLIGVAYLAFYKADDDARRSARPVAAEVQGILQQGNDSLALTRLPEEASLYLPLGIARPRPVGKVLVLADDPHKTAREDPARWKDRAPGGRIVAVERVPLKSAPGDARWKVYRLTVEPK
jgi:4-amino-4-deoxy-L-arabinose transferase